MINFIVVKYGRSEKEMQRKPQCKRSQGERERERTQKW